MYRVAANCESRAARSSLVCGLAVAVICSTLPAAGARAEPSTALLLAQAYQGPPTGYPPPPAHVAPRVVAPSPPNDETHGAVDGHADASTQISATAWFFAGFFLSWIGIILGYVLRPSVDGARLVGKSPAYVSAYTDAYQTGGRSYRGIHAVYGCVTSGAILLVLTIAFFALGVAAAGVAGG